MLLNKFDAVAIEQICDDTNNLKDDPSFIEYVEEEELICETQQEIAETDEDDSNEYEKDEIENVPNESHQVENIESENGMIYNCDLCTKTFG